MHDCERMWKRFKRKNCWKGPRYQGANSVSKAGGTQKRIGGQMSNDSAQKAGNDGVSVSNVDIDTGERRTNDEEGDRRGQSDRIKRAERARWSSSTRRLHGRKEMPRMRVAETVRLALVDQLVRRNQGRSMPEVMFGTTGRPVAWSVPRRRYHVGMSHGSRAERE